MKISFLVSFWSHLSLKRIKTHEYLTSGTLNFFCQCHQMRIKQDSHTLQEYGFSPVCVCMCIFKVELRENAEPHTSHK